MTAEGQAMLDVAVMGAGSWGTTFAQVVADAGHHVTIWGRRQEVVDDINLSHRNSGYLRDTVLSDRIRATTDPLEALAAGTLVILAVPAQSLRGHLAVWKEHLRPDTVLVSLMKGVEQGTHLTMSQVIAEETGWPAERIAVVSGPNLALEIAGRQPTATVVASTDADTAELLAHASANPYFRPYTNTDVIGVELGGAVKNVIALAVGIADGRGLGDNSKASIITRGLAETTRLAVALGADPHTLSGLAGLGDLVATCASPLSRNRTFGEWLGKGLTVEEVVAKTEQTAEGVKSGSAILELARSAGVEVPITQAVVAVLAGRLSVEDMEVRLMSRERKAEGE